MVERLLDLWREESGPTAVEYGLIAALIAVVIIAALIFLGGALSNTFNYIADEVNSPG